MFDSTFSASMPLVIGISFIVMGLIYLTMPSKSLIKLDRRVEAWVKEAPNPTDRRVMVIAAYKVAGGFISVCGLIYTLMNLGSVPTL